MWLSPHETPSRRPIVKAEGGVALGYCCIEATNLRYQMVSDSLHTKRSGSVCYLWHKSLGCKVEAFS
jgi:hypothetical protein